MTSKRVSGQVAVPDIGLVARIERQLVSKHSRETTSLTSNFSINLPYCCTRHSLTRPSCFAGTKPLGIFLPGQTPSLAVTRHGGKELEGVTAATSQPFSLGPGHFSSFFINDASGGPNTTEWYFCETFDLPAVIMTKLTPIHEVEVLFAKRLVSTTNTVLARPGNKSIFPFTHEHWLGSVVIIAGASDTPQGPQACIWFTETDDFGEDIWVIQILGSLSHDQPLNSFAKGVAWAPTDDKTYGELLVVGHSKSNQAPSEAFVWRGNRALSDTEPEPEFTRYFNDLEYILTKTGAGELSGMGSDWVLTEATGISVTPAYGTRIVGWGVNPEGGIEAWLVTDYPTHDDLFDDCIDKET